MSSYFLAPHNHRLCVLLKSRGFDVLGADMSSLGDVSEKEHPGGVWSPSGMLTGHDPFHTEGLRLASYCSLKRVLTSSWWPQFFSCLATTHTLA